MVRRVEWNIPFYYQLLIQEIINMLEPCDAITKELIDACMAKIVELRNDHHFEHYVKRLKRVFGNEQHQFVKAFLNHLSQHEQISLDEAMNIAHEMISEEDANRVIASLIYDGYIVTIKGNGNMYKFNSPILKMWWRNHKI